MKCRSEVEGGSWRGEVNIWSVHGRVKQRYLGVMKRRVREDREYGNRELRKSRRGSKGGKRTNIKVKLVGWKLHVQGREND